MSRLVDIFEKVEVDQVDVIELYFPLCPWARGNFSPVSLLFSHVYPLSSSTRLEASLWYAQQMCPGSGLQSTFVLHEENELMPGVFRVVSHELQMLSLTANIVFVDG